MESHVKILAVAIAAALYVVFSVAPGLAQEDSPKASLDRDASRAGSVSIGDGGTIKGSDAKGADLGVDRSAGQNRPREGGTARPGLPIRAGAGPGAEVSRTGTIAPADTFGMTSGNRGVMSNGRMGPAKPEDGFAGLQRRANRKTLIANTVQMPASSASPRSGTDGAMRNAIGVVVPSGRQGAGDTVPGTTVRAGTSANRPDPGAMGVGAAASKVDGVDLHRPVNPLNAVAGPATHTAGINGTTMGHIVPGPSYIGGPAKDRSGINGTTMRPKH